MAFSFNIKKPSNLSAVLQQATRKIRSNGGQLNGNEKEGYFSGSGVKGRYSVGNNILITITDKPVFAPKSLVISKITAFFSDAG